MANSWLSSAHPQAATWEPPLRRRGTRMVRDWLRRHFYEAFLPLLAVVDGALIMGVFLLTYALRFRWHLLAAAAAPPWVPYLWGMLFVSCIWTATLVGIGFYAPRRSPSKFDDLVLLIWGLMLGGMASVALGFFYRDFSYSRLVIAYGFLLSIAVLGIWHLLLRLAQERVQARGWLALNTLVVGCNNLGATIASRLAHSPRLGYRVVGFLPAPGEEQGHQEFFLPLPEAEAPAVPVGCTRILGNSRQLGGIETIRGLRSPAW